MRLLPTRQFNSTMQQATFFKLQMRYILIEGMQDGKAGQNGITMMPMVINLLKDVPRYKHVHKFKRLRILVCYIDRHRYTVLPQIVPQGRELGV